MAIRLLAVLVPVLTLPAILAQEDGAPPVPGDEPDARTDFIAAKVNDEFVTSYEVMKKIESAIKEIEGNELLNEEEKRRQKRFLWNAELRERVEERLMLQAAEKLDVKVAPEDVEKEVEEQASEIGGMEKLLEIISDQGMDLTEFQEGIRKQKISQELLMRKFGLAGEKTQARTGIDMFISPQEIRRFYDRNREQFVEPQRAKIRQLVLYSGKVGDVPATLDLARSIVLQLRQGADFAELARQYSHGPGAKEGGGWPTEVVDGKEVWAYLKPGTARPEVEQAAFSLAAGEVSEPIPVQIGLRTVVFVVQVVESIPARVLSLREVQSSIRDSLYEKKFHTSVQGIKRELLREAYIWPPNLFTSIEEE
ncbi:MAG: peptidyl-prolyl cis-trans isomerase [Planctomycetes bacterium]|nr:peptidyl-prolyl cis-trans isomerase [Planctomycetota bacterium]